MLALLLLSAVLTVQACAAAAGLWEYSDSLVHSRDEQVASLLPNGAIRFANPFALVAQSRGSGAHYEVERANSWLLAITDKTGAFSFAAHKHAVLATRFSAALTVHPEAPEKSAVKVTLPVSALVIDSKEARQQAGLGSGPSADDVRTIQERMLGPEVLDARTYPEIQFITTAIRKLSADQLQVSGSLQLHGHSQVVQIPVRYEREENGRFRLSGEFAIRQTDFALKPESVAGGLVRVADRVTIRFGVTIAPAK